jgi:hypothetical protein
MELGQTPITFEPNHGQTDPQVKFLTHTGQYTTFFTSTEAVMMLPEPSSKSRIQHSELGRPTATADSSQIATHVLRMQWVGANRNPEVIGLDRQPGVVSYFTGSEPSKWRANIPTFARVQYRDVYPGIDMIYYGNQAKMEYDFVLTPGVDPGLIRLNFAGADALRVDAAGDLLVQVGSQTLRQHKPVAYQQTAANRQDVAAEFSVRGQEVAFHIGTYDHRLPLVIDPVLSYSTYLGGYFGDLADGIAVDSAGNAFVCGYTYSPDFPTTAGAFDKTFNGNAGTIDAFVSKLNASGSALVYSTYLGGSSGDFASEIAVDSAGNAFVSGTSQSADFPTTLGAFNTSFRGGSDAFVTKLNTNGSVLVYSTYLGGYGEDASYGVAVDQVGNAFLSGDTQSPDFPTTAGAFDTSFNGNAGTFDTFVSKLNAAGSALVYSTYLGGSDLDRAFGGIAVDSAGNAFVSGYTDSTDFPTTAGAFDTSPNGFDDVYVTKLNPSGTALIYSTFLGGSNSDRAFGIAVDLAGSSLVTGHTQSSNFPTTPGAFDTSKNENLDAFVAKLDAAGSALVYSTYLGGAGTDGASKIAVDAAGNAFLSGSTYSSNFPTTADAFDTSLNRRGADAFFTKLNETGSALDYSTYIGGSFEDSAFGVAVDSVGSAYLGGFTQSINFPTTAGAFSTSYNGYGDAFVTKFSGLRRRR